MNAVKARIFCRVLPVAIKCFHPSGATAAFDPTEQVTCSAGREPQKSSKHSPGPHTYAHTHKHPHTCFDISQLQLSIKLQQKVETFYRGFYWSSLKKKKKRKVLKVFPVIQSRHSKWKSHSWPVSLCGSMCLSSAWELVLKFYVLGLDSFLSTWSLLSGYSAFA